MVSIRTLLDTIIENGTSGKQVIITVANRNEYETVRTRLVALWTAHRNIIRAVGSDGDPFAELSLCGSYNAAGAEDHECTATFFLGIPRRKAAKSYSFAIVDTATSASGVDTTADTVARVESAVIDDAANDELPLPTPRIS